MFRYRKLASALMIAGAMNANYAAALGLGEMTMHSALNQPLDAEISLKGVGDLDSSQILVGMADNKSFEDAGIERTFFLSNIKFDVVFDSSGDGVIKLKSKKLLNEPYLDFLLEVKWPTGRVLRSYTALVDLPVYTEAQAPVVNLGPGSKEVPEVPPAEKVTAQPVQTVDVSETASADVPAEDVVEEQPVYAAEGAVGEVADQDAASGTYRIQRNDTLWGIARKLQPSKSISVQQTMLAIQRMNEQAFVDGNINRLKAGEVLRVPTEGAVREISAREAMNEVAQQNRQWQAAQLDATESRELTQRPLAQNQEGYLRLSSAGTGKANGVDEEGAEGGASARAAQNDALEVSQRENEELNTRVDSLSSQVEQLQRMIELKDAQLATLQQQLGQAGAEVPEVEPVPEAVEPEVIAEADAPSAEAATPEDVAPPEQATEEKPAEKSPAPVAPPAAEEAPGLLDEILAKPIYLGGVALAILLIVVGVIFRRKSKSEQAAFDELANFEFDAGEQPDEQFEADFAEGVVSDDTIEQDVFEENIDEIGGEEEAAEPQQTTTMQTGDAIGEADIYIAYGRYEQAAELLLNAIAASPNEVELRTKLLEVYLESQNKAGFQEQFRELQSRGQSDAVSYAKELLTSVEGASGWLDDMPAASSAAAVEEYEEEIVDEDLGLDLDLDLGLGDVEPETAETDIEDDLSLDFEDFSLASTEAEDATRVGDAISIDDALLAEPAAEEETLIEQAVEDDLGLDLDMDLGLVNADENEAADEEEIALDLEDGLETLDEAENFGLDQETIDLDDDLSLDLSGIDETALSDAKPIMEEEPAEADDVLEFDGLELDVELPSAEIAETVAAEPEAESADDFALDLDLDLSSFSAEEPSEAIETAEDEVFFSGLEAGQEDLSIGEGVSTSASVEDSLDFASEDMSFEEADFDLSGLAEVDTDMQREEALDSFSPVGEGGLAAEEDTFEIQNFTSEEAGEAFTAEALDAEAADFDLQSMDDVADIGMELVEPAIEEAPVEDFAPVEPEAVDEPAAEVIASTPFEDMAAQAPAAFESVTEVAEESPLATLEGEDLEFLSDADEVSTKLDLARAYVEMGDVDGARDILMEVMKEGNDEQKGEASSLLDSLD